MGMGRFHFERALHRKGVHGVAGVDEAGRGPLAGPVVAAAVMLPRAWIESRLPRRFAGLNDSKQLTAARREDFAELLRTDPEVRWAIAEVPSGRIDAVNILQATHQAIRQALDALSPAPVHALVDGLPIRSLGLPQTALVRGDSRSYSIAAASVLAKTTRDRIMMDFDRLYPGYGFAEHKGYGTPRHIAALAELGPCRIHRQSFAPVRRPHPELNLFDG